MQIIIDVTQSTDIIDDLELLCTGYESLTSLCQDHHNTSAEVEQAGDVLYILNAIQRGLIDKLKATKT